VILKLGTNVDFGGEFGVFEPESNFERQDRHGQDSTSNVVLSVTRTESCQPSSKFDLSAFLHYSYRVCGCCAGLSRVLRPRVKLGLLSAV
jgi:hypothetical protein